MPKPRRVLVVDPCPDTRLSTAWLLRWWGYEADTAEDGRAALERYGAYRPQVVLTELALPELNGFRLAGALRCQPGGPGLLLAAVTGQGSAADRRRCREAGFDCHLLKPVEPGVLQQLLAGRAGGVRSGAENRVEVFLPGEATSCGTSAAAPGPPLSSRD